MNVQRHRLDKGNDGICISNFRESHGSRQVILARTLDIPRLGNEKKWYGTLPHPPEGKWDSTANLMVERFKDTGHRVFKSISASSRGILNKKNDRDTIHFNAVASNTELLFQIIHSVNQLSVYGAVSTWCEQFGLAEEEKVQEKQKEFVTKGALTSVKSQEVKLLVSPPKLVSGSRLRGKTFRPLPSPPSSPSSPRESRFERDPPSKS